jgi:hypothetical protein
MLKKLSLAALVAMGSMSVASATDLSEAIKGVNLKGALRIRLYNEDPEKGSQYNKWRTNAAFIFAVPVSEDLKLVDRVSTETYINGQNGSDASGANRTAAANVNSGLADNVLFAKYSKNGLTVLAGKIPVATPVTDTDLFGPPSHGAGALATYKVNDSLILAGAYVDALVATDVPVGANDTYAAAAIYNNDAIALQAWFFNVENIINSDIVLSADIKALKDSGLTIHVDYAQAELDHTFSKDTQTYTNVNATFKKDAVCAKIGYAVTGEDGGRVVLDTDSKLAAVSTTHQNTSIVKKFKDDALSKDDNMLYAKVGYNVDEKTNVYVAYSAEDTNSVNEVEVGAKYQYTKKFTLSAYYSMLTADSGDNNEARAEAIYKF